MYIRIHYLNKLVESVREAFGSISCAISALSEQTYSFALNKYRTGRIDTPIEKTFQ